MAGQQIFNMGQIIYIISNKDMAVYPAVVEEQIVRKIRQADGIHEVINYKICIGPKGKQHVVDLSKINGEVFDSVESVKTTLLQRSNDEINRMVNEARENVGQWYGISPEEQAVRNTAAPVEKYDPALLLQTSSQELQLQQNGLNPHASMRENIRAMVQETDDGMHGLGLPNNNGTKTVILEDGTRMQVKF